MLGAMFNNPTITVEEQAIAEVCGRATFAFLDEIVRKFLEAAKPWVKETA